MTESLLIALALGVLLGLTCRVWTALFLSAIVLLLPGWLDTGDGPGLAGGVLLLVSVQLAYFATGLAVTVIRNRKIVVEDRMQGGGKVKANDAALRSEGGHESH